MHDHLPRHGSAKKATLSAHTSTLLLPKLRGTIHQTMRKSSNQSVMLADNFPAKAHLLVTHLTESDPDVGAFSPGGDSFEIYDQSIFASKYLPQYFKVCAVVFVACPY